jgi:hypothetical protein
MKWWVLEHNLMSTPEEWRYQKGCWHHNRVRQDKRICLNTYSIEQALSILDKSFTIYLIARNPYDRLLSDWLTHYALAHTIDNLIGDAEAKRLLGEQTFGSFIERLTPPSTVVIPHPENPKWAHRTSLTQPLLNEAISQLITAKKIHILKFETLTPQVWDEIRIRHHLPSSPAEVGEKQHIIDPSRCVEKLYDFPIKNLSARSRTPVVARGNNWHRPPTKCFYNQAMVNKVYQSYLNDFKYLNLKKSLGDISPDMGLRV